MFAISTAREAVGPVVRVKSYRDVLEEYLTHPEAKSAGLDGTACHRATSGLLQRRPIHAAYFYYIGKESNLFEEVEHGLVHDLAEVQARYDDPHNDHWRIVLTVLKMMRRAEVARAASISERHAQRLRNGKQRPSGAVRPRDC